MNNTLRQAWVGLRFLIAMTVLLGVVYPTGMFLVGRLDSWRSDGSYVTDKSGAVVGSALIGQSFDGNQWFHPRPSAAGKGYDALSSGGTNLAADNPTLIDSVTKAKAAVAAENGVDPSQVPADAVTSSGSGLDPHITPAYAAIQVARVAKARGLDPAVVTKLVDQNTDHPILGFLGDPGVNVLNLNIALDSLG
jgi:K+-transporting ATPase ATPase C chain